MEIANEIAANDPRMVQGAKQLIVDDVGARWQEMYRNELDAQEDKLHPTPIEEGFKEFLDRKGRK